MQIFIDCARIHLQVCIHVKTKAECLQIWSKIWCANAGSQTWPWHSNLDGHNLKTVWDNRLKVLICFIWQNKVLIASGKLKRCQWGWCVTWRGITKLFRGPKRIAGTSNLSSLQTQTTICPIFSVIWQWQEYPPSQQQLPIVKGVHSSLGNFFPPLSHPLTPSSACVMACESATSHTLLIKLGENVSHPEYSWKIKKQFACPSLVCNEVVGGAL